MNPNGSVYLVTCLKCKDEARIRILPGNQVMYIDHTPIIACRFRGDLKWGFECVCGNDSRLAREEKDDAPVLMQQGDSRALDKLVKSLNTKDENKFRMVGA